MAEMNKKPTPGRKIFIAAVLLLILVGFPAVSWIYLRDGLNWRKKAVGELSSYGQIPKANIIWPDGLLEDQLNSKVVVAHLFANKAELTAETQKILDTNQQIFDQFGRGTHFSLVMIAEDATTDFRSYTQKLPGSDFANWLWLPANGAWPSVLNNGFESYCVKGEIDPYPYYYALADTAGVIRRFYNALDEKEVGRMVEQIAILLPQE